MFTPRYPSTGPRVESVGARDAHEQHRDGAAVIVDVREADEWAEAHIPGAVHIPLSEIAARADELPRDRTLVIQCRSGNRSFIASQLLLANGFERVRNLEGGISAWAAAGLPLEA